MSRSATIPSIGPHVVIAGHTRIGCDNRIFQFCSIGEQPQDKKYAGEPTRLEIGDRNTIREFCTFNCGTAQDAGVTRSAMTTGSWPTSIWRTTARSATRPSSPTTPSSPGHVHVGDWAILGGFTGVHQFVRIGAHSFTAVGCVLLQDLPPFVMAAGNPAVPRSINAEGLKRRGYSTDAVAAVKRAFKTLYKSGLRLEEARAAIEAERAAVPELAPLTDFLAAPGRGIIR
jgi:UDP-N-acetylglucosamine acyltransferase